MKKLFIFLLILLTTALFAQSNDLESIISEYNQQHETEYNQLVQMFQNHSNNKTLAMYQRKIESLHSEILILQTQIKNLIENNRSYYSIETYLEKLQTKMNSFKRIEQEYLNWKNTNI